MTDTATPGPGAAVTVGLARELAPWRAEVAYTLDTVLTIAGYARRWQWADPGAVVDVYYGPADRGAGTLVTIPWSGRAFDRAGEEEPTGWLLDEGLPVVAFAGETASPLVVINGCMRHATDAVFAAFWWLSGAREPHYPRDRVDNVSLSGSFLRTSELAGRPWVSLWAAALRERFEASGRPARRPGWGAGALALSHDVDYPEILRVIEWLRRPRDAAAIASEAAPFWGFDAWADLSETMGSASTFYFMARKGSLLRYAAGDPDAFYDVAAPRYRALTRHLLERGCEIGLHASFRSSEEPERFAREKARIEEVCGRTIIGNRQHYWRLYPDAPHETLAHLAEAGFVYDSSLAFERMPGFRRGVCHPFRPWHAGRRAAIDLVEIPPAWMDDHYDGRLPDTGITSPERHAAGLLGDVVASGGIVVLDYHVRGMNERFFPRWGKWLRGFLSEARPAELEGRTPGELAMLWREHEAALAARSSQDWKESP